MQSVLAEARGEAQLGQGAQGGPSNGPLQLNEPGEGLSCAAAPRPQHQHGEEGTRPQLPSLWSVT